MLYPLNAPLFDLLVLSIVSRDDAYGYKISQTIKTASNMKDSTLYPVLKRLQESKFLETYDEQFQGRNRKYYTITDEGKAHCEMLINEWECYKTAIDNIVNGGMISE